MMRMVRPFNWALSVKAELLKSQATGKRRRRDREERSRGGERFNSNIFTLQMQSIAQPELDCGLYINCSIRLKIVHHSECLGPPIVWSKLTAPSVSTPLAFGTHLSLCLCSSGHRETELTGQVDALRFSIVLNDNQSVKTNRWDQIGV